MSFSVPMILPDFYLKVYETKLYSNQKCRGAKTRLEMENEILHIIFERI